LPPIRPPKLRQTARFRIRWWRSGEEPLVCSPSRRSWRDESSRSVTLLSPLHVTSRSRMPRPGAVLRCRHLHQQTLLWPVANRGSIPPLRFRPVTLLGRRADVTSSGDAIAASSMYGPPLGDVCIVLNRRARPRPNKCFATQRLQLCRPPLIRMV
jgi:hypothetical protein